MVLCMLMTQDFQIACYLVFSVIKFGSNWIEQVALCVISIKTYLLINMQFLSKMYDFWHLEPFWLPSGRLLVALILSRIWLHLVKQSLWRAKEKTQSLVFLLPLLYLKSCVSTGYTRNPSKLTCCSQWTTRSGRQTKLDFFGKRCQTQVQQLLSVRLHLNWI